MRVDEIGETWQRAALVAALEVLINIVINREES